MPFFSPFGGSSNPSGGSSGGFGSGNVESIGAGVSDLFGASADQAKASGDYAEQTEYTEAAGLATQNEQFTAQSTAIKEAQQNREITQSLGKTMADVAGAGFAESGSALDILRSSAQQGAITQAVASQQGLITEAGYAERSQSYRRWRPLPDRLRARQNRLPRVLTSQPALTLLPPSCRNDAAATL